MYYNIKVDVFDVEQKFKHHIIENNRNLDEFYEENKSDFYSGSANFNSHRS
jgi:hypothetical protein